MKITSKQINALYEITADTDEPVEIVQTKQPTGLMVKIGKGKRAVLWHVRKDGHSIPVAPPLKASKGKAGKTKPAEPDAMARAHAAATEAGLAVLRESS